MESSRSSQLLENFAKKKQEREQEIMEIQEMLNKIKSPQKSSDGSRPDSSREEDIELKDEEIVKKDVKDNENKKPEKKSMYRRSYSEINLKKPKESAADAANPRISRRDTQRTSTTNGSLNKPRSKSSQVPLSATECQSNHKKSYNPEEARRYMEMQKKQRKFGSFGNEAALKSKIEKEEIKKRLEELKKNTRKLVSKNIQKKEKINNKNLQKSQTENKNLNKNKVKESIEKTGKLKENSYKEITTNLETTEAKKSNTEYSNNNTNIPEISQRSTQSINNILKPSGFALQETNKRIGLLRKAENDKDFSFSSHRNFNFDKENQNLEQLTKQLTCPKENKQNKEINIKENKEDFSKEDKKEQAVQTSIKDLKKSEEIIDLEVPATNLISNEKQESLKDHSEVKNSRVKDSNKPHDLPYWLRPSAAQVYPYNFIMAVRRKLEAIAEPMATNNSKQRNQETSTTGLDTKTKHKKRKSLDLLEGKRTKKLKKKQEENVVEQSLKELQSMKENSNIKQLKPLPQTIDINKSLEKSLAIEKQQKEKSENDLQKKPDVPIEPLTQFKYLQKSLESKEDKHFNKSKSFYQTSDIAPFRPSACQKSLQSLSSEPEETKQNSLLTSNHKSIESINSEINSNLSSISLQLPISNTLTEVSSLKTESRRTFNHSTKPPQTEDDITSLSSQVYSSPEKRCKKSQEEFVFLKPRPISPLIFSSPEKKSQKAAKDFEFVKPRPVSPLSLDKVQKLKIKRKEVQVEEEKEDKEMDFSQLLEDFNRSLSQVIQVNEQLKCTLDKSHQILSPHSSKKSTETDKHYSSDFEKSSTKLASSLESDKKLKDSLLRNNEKLKQRKRQLFEMAEKVKPLLTLEKRKEEDANEKPLPELNLDFKSLSDTPETSETEKPTETEMEDEEELQISSSNQAKHSYEKRLNEIEKLKETLKQTILESKEKRKERQMRKEREREEYKGNEIQTRTLSYRKEIYKETKEQTDSIKDSQKQREGEEYKGNDIQTANLSYKKQNYKESKEQTDSSKTRTQSKEQSHTESEIPSEIETESEMAKNSTRNSTKSSDTHKALYKDYKTYEKYEKQYKNSLRERNNGNSNISPYESKTDSNKSQKETPTDSTTKERLQTGSSETKSYSIHSKEASTDLTKDKQNNYKISEENFSSNYTKSSNKTSSNHTPNTHKQTPYETSETETYSGTQSDMESLKSKSITKTTKTPTASITSSIAEELQNTYETASQDNENIPLTKSKRLPTKNISFKQESSKHFIKSHINRSRGDFPETLSKEAQLNETQFQQAIEAASQISSSEFVQSADDEITSSVASKSYHHKSISNPPSYNAVAGGRLVTKTTSSPSKTQRRLSIGSEIVKFFTEYDCERAERRMTIDDSMSESSLNYSNVGLYDKLIQNETNKSQHLTALLKMREKALLDRTKGQIAWLEVQKVRYKAKGLINHIAVIKKKQRGILLKMEKEREEIKRLLQTTTANSKVTVEANIPQTTSGHKVNSQHNTPTKAKKEKLLSYVPTLTKPKINSGPQLVKPENAISATPILKATYELESSQALEELLKKREEDLRKRREHVERLMQWHQRLDEEEAEVLNLERQLLNYNNVPHMVEQLQQPKLQTITYSASTEKLTSAKDATSPILHEQEVIEKTIKSSEKIRASRARKMEKRLKEIDKSLRELSHISASSTTSVVMGQTNNEREDTVSSVATQEVDYVRTTGIKLNKLWKSLTSQQIEKFEPTRRYKLCKSDLERLYEEAKMAVLRDFAEDEERIAQELLEKSNSNLSSTASPTPQQNLPATASESHSLEVPALNLNFSSGHSEPEEESANNSQTNVTQQGNYSPSVAEQNFKAHALLNSSASSETASEKQTPRDIKQTSRLENNVQMFLALSQRIQATTGKRMGGGGGGLQRSLSDTEISDVPKFKADKTTTSQKNIANVTSQSNSSITTNSSARSYDGSGQQQQHQRSKSSIVEMTNIPSTQTETITNHTDVKQTSSSSTLHTDNQQDKESKQTSKDLEDVKKSPNNNLSKRSSVICSVGTVTPIKSSSQQTSSNIVTITEDSNSSETLKTKSITKDSISSKIPSATISKQKSTYSAQFSTDSSSKAKEISSKLEEISAAVTQLSQMNALPSYESVTQSHARNKSIEEPLVTETNDESNLSTDASSYSFNFDHIATDKHSSPGTSTSSFHSNSLQNKTLTSKTFTKDLDQQQQQTLSPQYTNSITSNSSNSIKSKTFVKNDNEATNSNTLTPSALDNHIPDTYEADFESDLSNVTHIEDITIPTFETTNETIQEDEDAEEEISTKSPSKVEDISNDQSKENLSCEASDKTYNAEELKNKTYNAEDVRNSPSAISEKSLTTISARNQKPSPDRELLPPPPLPPPPPPPSTSASNAAVTTATQNGNGNQLMPDIINELELRRHQLILDNEQLKQYEHVTAVPYMYVREIPNKPPPPYVPPAHGSPMTTIFPSEDRIKDITYRRTHELYCELLKTDYCNEKGEKLPSVNDEQITNIYERIILDICREYLEDHAEILRDGDPTNFHSQLAFFNPPNRLRCIQDAIYKEVRSCLAMDKVQPKRTQIYSVYGQRAKQDHIGKIIIQEMYDEDDRWCNFHREESEVLHLMVEEMINKNIASIAREVLVEEGGTIEEEEEVAVDQSLAAEETTIADENEANHQVEEGLEEESKGQEEQSQLLQTSSVLVETLNEDDKTYCVNETKQDYTTVLNQTTPRIDTSPTENVNNSNDINSLNTTTNTTTPNAVQTCT